MSGNSFGKLFRITTFGESHGEALGVVIDGCPAGLPLDTQGIQKELDRRKPGQSKLVSPRREEDQFKILSGVFEGKTIGSPIAALVYNNDGRSKDYSAIKSLFRPGHADFTYFAKYGHRDYRGGGRSSARETIGRVIGGAVAKQLLGTIGVSFQSGLAQVGNVVAEEFNWEAVGSNELHALDPNKVEAMREEIEAARKDRDSVGGMVVVRACGVSTGWGEPVFEKLDAQIASAMMSIPAVKQVSVGDGHRAASSRGSEFNDQMRKSGFLSNRHGGVLGGISSGAPIEIRLSLKPTSSIPKELKTIDDSFEDVSIKTLGRHDPCVALRALAIAEAMLALVLVDFWMQQEATSALSSHFAPREAVKYNLRDG